MEFYDTYVKPYTCSFAVGALAGYFLTEAVIGAMPNTIPLIGVQLSQKSKFAVTCGLYATGASVACKALSL